ncbi:MAG TPA: alpha/beta hydrolase [Actinobacteria bacterium]|nr:alpha/beta hydrolase [Actinomycetota bacterium]
MDHEELPSAGEWTKRRMTDGSGNGSSPEHGFVVVDGLRLHYLDFGGEGKPLVLLHGVTSHAWVWRYLAPHLTHRRLVALDSRGHGDSQWSEGHQYETEDLASDVVEFIDVIGLGGVDIVGGSWGGLVGLQVATRVPNLVDSLTMIDIPPSFPGPASEVHTDPGSDPNHARSVAYLRDTAEYMDEAIGEALAAFGVRPGKNGRLYTKHDDYFHEQRPHRAVDYWEELESLRMPVLFVRADNSTHLSAPVAERMLQVAHNAQLVTISETGHRIPTDNPVALGRVLRDFLGP